MNWRAISGRPYRSDRAEHRGKHVRGEVAGVVRGGGGGGQGAGAGLGATTHSRAQRCIAAPGRRRRRPRLHPRPDDAAEVDVVAVDHRHAAAAEMLASKRSQRHRLAAGGAEVLQTHHLGAASSAGAGTRTASKRRPRWRRLRRPLSRWRATTLAGTTVSARTTPWIVNCSRRPPDSRRPQASPPGTPPGARGPRPCRRRYRRRRRPRGCYR